MPALNNNTQYCHCVDRNNSDNLIIPGTLTVAGVAVAPVALLSEAPVALEESGVTAAQLYTALASLGLVVDVA